MKHLVTTCMLALILAVAGIARAETLSDDKTTTFTCIGGGGAGPEPTSPASPHHGAVYRVGEPVLLEPDPEYSTGVFCPPFPPLGPPPSPAIASVTRSIDQPGINGIVRSDSPEVVHFNVPGTVWIRRRAMHHAHGVRTKTNVITIIDDGPGPHPPPVSAPPGEKRPRVNSELLRTRDGETGAPYSIITLDGSYQALQSARVWNDGDAPLVLKSVYQWIGSPKSRTYPIDFIPDTVLLPGQSIFLQFKMEMLDPEGYMESSPTALQIIETNDPVRPYRTFGPGRFEVFDTAEDIPDGFPEPLKPPENSNVPDYSCSCDTNNDGVIDAADIVESLLDRGN